MQNLEHLIKTYIRRFSRDAVDLAHWPANGPTLERVDDNGNTVIEKVPSMAHIKMVHPQGAIIRMGLYNGMGRPQENDPYKMQILTEKLNKGFIPYGACPKMIGLGRFLPKDIRDSPPCTHAIETVKDEKGKAVKIQVPIDDEHPCACIGAVRKARNKAQAEAMRKLENKGKSMADRELEQRIASNDDLASLVRAMKEERDDLMALLEEARADKGKGK